MKRDELSYRLGRHEQRLKELGPSIGTDVALAGLALLKEFNKRLVDLEAKHLSLQADHLVATRRPPGVEKQNDRVTDAIFRAERAIDLAIVAWEELRESEREIAWSEESPAERDIAWRGFGYAEAVLKFLLSLRKNRM